MAPSSTIDTRLHPLEALGAVRRLFKNPDDTRQVFIVLRAMRGKSLLRLYRRFSASPTGASILHDRRCLLDTLRDHENLARQPAGSLGRAYLDFMTKENLSADGLAALAKSEWRPQPTDDLALLSERMRDSHDLGHVVTGYGRDPLGELCLLAFNFAQTGNLGMGMIAGFGLLRILRTPGAAAARRAVVEAWRRGRKAAWLGGQDWEALMACDLASVREKLAVGADAHYHGAVA